MNNFGLIGASGYIAPRHMAAIKNNGCNLILATDPNDSVGVIDSYFLKSKFFKEIERFEEHIHLRRGTKEQVDAISICSPNYLHTPHIMLGLRNSCDIICEKPIVLSTDEIWNIKKAESEFSKKVNCILQLRLHNSVLDLKKNIDTKKTYDVNLEYITSRGNWYQESWKGDPNKSGGVAMNIGIHFFDILIYLFGSVINFNNTIDGKNTMAGFIKLERANVFWKLSTDYNELPEDVKKSGSRVHRVLKIEDKLFDFSKGFTDLHDKSYSMILNNKGFSLDDCLESIDLVEKINNHRRNK